MEVVGYSDGIRRRTCALSNMPSLKKDMVVRNLIKKGFEQDERDHLYLCYVRSDGLRTSIRTKVSHGSKSDITTGLVSAMARQCHITTQQFRRLAECTLYRQQYEQLLTIGGQFSRRKSRPGNSCSGLHTFW